MNSSKKKIFKIIFILIITITILSNLVSYIINSQRQRAIKEMANKILSAAEYYVVSQIMDNNIKDVIVKFPDNSLLDIGGNLPTNGYIKITSNSKIEILYYYNGYCVSKSQNETDNSFKRISKKECLKTKIS